MDLHPPDPAHAGRRASLRDSIHQLFKSTNPNGDAKRAFVQDIWPSLMAEYNTMMETVKTLCKASLTQISISCVVEGRTKTPESVRKSLERRLKDHQPQTQTQTFDDIGSEIHDLVGLRIILDFPCDINKVDAFIQDNFCQLREPVVFSHDRDVGKHWKTWFGAYQTRNYRVSLKVEEHASLAGEFLGVMFEIQLTTIAEGLYNKFAHDLLYKGAAGDLTREEEMVVDLSHGLSLCYGLCIMYMKDKLDSATNPGTTEEAPTNQVSESAIVHQITTNGNRFLKDLTRSVNGKSYRLQDLQKESSPEDPLDRCLSLSDLNQWLRNLDNTISESHQAMQQLGSVSESHLRLAEEGRDLTKENLQIQRAMFTQGLSEQEEKCHQLFRLVAGSNDATYEWYKDRVENRVEGTSEWFLNHESFKHWVEQDSGLLLVSADPGCGKSVLAKYLIDDLLPRSATTCYFFFKDQDQHTIKQALCALLHQLFSHKPSLIKHAMAEYSKNGANLPNVTASLQSILENVGKDPETGSVIMVIDALDECREPDLRDLILMLKNLFKASGRLCRVKFLLTSRPYEQIMSRFYEVAEACIRIPGEEESDAISREVDCVIHHQVKLLARDKRLRQGLEQYLLRRLTTIQHRTYLWIYLIFDYLRSQDFKRTEKGLEKVIDSLPESFYEAYEKILSKSKNRRMVRKALCIILAARRPLTLVEMNFAVNIDISTNEFDLEQEEDFKSNLRSWCGLFVSVYGGKVYFLHQSAREFLLTDVFRPEAISWHCSIPAYEAHAVLAEACVRYLEVFIREFNFHIFNGGNNHNTDVLAFNDYSAMNWIAHLREACISSDDAILYSAERLCETDSRTLMITLDTFPESLILPAHLQSGSKLMVASVFGLSALVQWLLDKGAGIESRDNTGETALSWAVRRGNEAIVQLLLHNGAKIESRGDRSRTPLSWAVRSGNEAMAQLLLDNGAEIDSRDYRGRTPLSWAIMSWNEAMVQLLLDHDADVDSRDDRGRTPLSWAIMSWNEAIPRLLIANDAEIDSRDDRGRTPLSWAIMSGNEAMVQLLLDNGADIDSRDDRGQTPLSWAARSTGDDIIQLLHDGGVVDGSRDGGFNTPISWTIARINKAIVQLLLDNGAEIDSRDDRGRTPLSWAVRSRNRAIAQLLREHGANRGEHIRCGGADGGRRPRESIAGTER
ncbi:hypothetical protein S7711_05474 [Stachybotrys chartarum IBT 7711]|uniref:NACHT domain-containing protein n=1 Tax=Stachybotrys chartarum (strain CBS 109288 / IBT 7711) TaxID=1280523 RepID=A0A084BAZ8_STACB|nr:hypothetical protein S7711_05474 [Stachybotrys chartarum IBT 7711]